MNPVQLKTEAMQVYKETGMTPLQLLAKLNSTLTSAEIERKMDEAFGEVSTQESPNAE